jgi:hypothetical protein
MHCVVCQKQIGKVNCRMRWSVDEFPPQFYLASLSLTILVDWNDDRDTITVKLVDNSPWNHNTGQSCRMDVGGNATNPGTLSCGTVECRDGYQSENETCAHVQQRTAYGTVVIENLRTFCIDTVYAMQDILIRNGSGFVLKKGNFPQFSSNYSMTNGTIAFDIFSENTDVVNFNCTQLERMLDEVIHNTDLVARQIEVSLELHIRVDNPPGIAGVHIHLQKTDPSTNYSCNANSTFSPGPPVAVADRLMIILGTASLVCICLSITGLVILVVCFLSCERFRSFPSRMQVCLSLSLIAAQVCVLLNPLLVTHHDMCRCLGIVMHWAYLSTFTWLNAIARDVWVKMRSDAGPQSRSGSSVKQLVGYACYSWISPVVIVAASALFDTFVSDDNAFSPRYGESRCWINQPLSLVVFFDVPVGLLLLSNVIFFVWTVVVIVKSSAQTSSYGSQQTPSEFVTCVKLFVLMGLTWVVGFLVPVLDNDIFWFAFVLLNSSHGLFLFIALV